MENISNTYQTFKLSGEKGSEATEHISKPALTFWQDAWRRFKKNKVAVVAGAIVILSILFALVSVAIVPDSSANSAPTNLVTYQNLPPKIGSGDNPTYTSQNVPEGTSFIFGTDSNGRSVAKRTVEGFRISLLIAFMAILFDIVIGITYGLIAGWVGGVTDTIMQRIIEIISSIPNLVIVTMLGLLLGQGVIAIVLSIGLFIWVGIARQVRNLVLSVKEQEFVLAAQTLGESPFKIMLKHILPNIFGVIIVQIMFDIPTAIFFEAFLSQINLGVQPPTASLGSMIQDGVANFQSYPWQLAVPAIVLSLISLAFFLFGYGLRDAFDPRATEE
ncbi:MAG: ABC transporter permease [Streptococcaceae bacterium]|jgi:oligopeptide transport system permease protein|nr:ABC transporter permease [Streptococcaceae bacterium]